MKFIKLLYISLLSLMISGYSVAEIEYKYIDEMTAKQAYQFTRENVDVVKKLIHSSLAIVERKSTIYRELAKLGKPFEGGEIVPKKLFAPITLGEIFISYTFTELSSGEQIYGIYGSSIEKRYSSKYWDYASIDISADTYGQATNFLDSDFEEFNLEFKEKIDPKSLSEYKKSTYASDTCHMLYRFDRMIDKVGYRFYFCVNKDNYDENAKYPNKWGRLVIVRW